MMVDISVLTSNLIAGDRATLARAITLIESRRADHQRDAQALLKAVLPLAGRAIRLGITGVPGAGKSTLIDALGIMLTGRGHRVAVLAVDPSSTVSGGSILGDKTRMARLAVEANAFIRPSPSAGTLGGVAAKTREAMLLTEAAGYDVIIVETVGVGQSEVAVAGMVDFFLVLMAPGTGDDLQGIKKGILELADMVAVNKADGDNAPRARQAASDYLAALAVMMPAEPDWPIPVKLVSGLTGGGLDEVWDSIGRHRTLFAADGRLVQRRARQNVAWMWNLFEARLLAEAKSRPLLRARMAELEEAVRSGRTTVGLAVDEMFALLKQV
ncbi:MAG: methylmalonyl Co-A mutase-associated GTPase MeaB [Hyphomicrobiales bacterium]|nr:methylmalonyl Co-A mutase-associated GTPase MeaB [Hyphomicrobiales bacterium]OQW83630.1 MAG: ATPase/protein kinase [Proteobacteria bacterium ST_bin15]